MYESDYIARGWQMVDELLAKGILVRSEGAVIADLSAYNLGVLPFLRSDGTALYPVADLPLAVAKIEENKLDESIYVVDIRQSLYFKQLFKVLELMGYQQKMVHLAYDFVKLPGGMMSSRTGNIISYEVLYETVFANAQLEVKERNSQRAVEKPDGANDQPVWPQEKVDEIARKMTVGALKFEMIKVAATQTITFDTASALKFEGFTAAYLQYAYARIQSIKRKARQVGPADYTCLVETKERKLLLAIASFPQAVAKASAAYDPSEIAKYLFKLAQQANDYYHSCPILKSEEPLRSSRLALVSAAAEVLKVGLDLLGIDTMDEM
jgi:arginyl-tRNA synthetase